MLQPGWHCLRGLLLDGLDSSGKSVLSHPAGDDGYMPQSDGYTSASKGHFSDCFPAANSCKPDKRLYIHPHRR